MAQQPLYTVSDGSISVNVGAMRHSITITQLGLSSPPATDAAGPVKTYLPFLSSLMAAIEVLRGTDVIRGGLITSQVFLTVLIWYQPGVLPNMRVQNLDNGNVYVVQSINNILERNEVLLLQCIGLGLNE